MLHSPFISICMPVYNGAPYLSEALKSALKQTYPHFEVLIIDDKSTDNSFDIIKSYCRLDTRIRVLQNSQNLGLVNNWNRCIKNAKGEWIKFLFQDDCLKPNCLETMVNHYKNSLSEELVIFCKRNFIFENDCSNEMKSYYKNRNYFWDIFPNKIHVTPKDITMIISRYPGLNIFGEPTSFLIHRSVFDRLGLFDADIYQICDLEYWLRAGVSIPLLHIPEVLTHFRVHNKSTTSFNRNERWVQTRYIDRLRLFNKFISNDLYSSLRKDLDIWPCRLFLAAQTAIFARRARIDTISGDGNQKTEFMDYCKKNHEIAFLSKQKYYFLAIKYLLSRVCLELKYAISRLNS